MKDKLSDRLRGRYKVGPDGVYGTRDFSDFIPPINFEAADRIDELEEALRSIATIDETVSEDPLGLVQNICHEIIGI